MAKGKYWNGSSWEVIGTTADKVKFNGSIKNVTVQNVEENLVLNNQILSYLLDYLNININDIPR
jgi:hypothetical protein